MVGKWALATTAVSLIGYAPHISNNMCILIRNQGRGKIKSIDLTFHFFFLLLFPSSKWWKIQKGLNTYGMVSIMAALMAYHVSFATSLTAPNISQPQICHREMHGINESRPLCKCLMQTYISFYLFIAFFTNDFPCEELCDELIAVYSSYIILQK